AGRRPPERRSEWTQLFRMAAHVRDDEVPALRSALPLVAGFEMREEVRRAVLDLVEDAAPALLDGRQRDPEVGGQRAIRCAVDGAREQPLLAARETEHRLAVVEEHVGQRAGHRRRPRPREADERAIALLEDADHVELAGVRAEAPQLIAGNL